MSLIQLKLSGRTVGISTLWQQETYAGLLEGYPNARMNERHLEWLLPQANRLFPTQPFFLARPYITRAEGDIGPWGPREDLPRVSCLGLGSCYDSHAGEYMTLVLGWLQDTPAPPIPPAVLAELQLADFDRLARREEL